VETMLFLCEQMARFFAQNINRWPYSEEGDTVIIHSSRSNSRKSPNNHGNSQDSSPEVSPTQIMITPKYSAEEENWVQGQLKNSMIVGKECPWEKKFSKILSCITTMYPLQNPLRQKLWLLTKKDTV